MASLLVGLVFLFATFADWSIVAADGGCGVFLGVLVGAWRRRRRWRVPTSVCSAGGTTPTQWAPRGQ
jgi:hypothetical protein